MTPLIALTAAAGAAALYASGSLQIKRGLSKGASVRRTIAVEPTVILRKLRRVKLHSSMHRKTAA
ncbi:MAG: hypothetical protein ACI8Z5_002750 [Lentimonas sp.]|jgi:hypothetical protein